MFPGKKFSFAGESFPSGVPDQPLTDAQTLQGALNRADNAFNKYVQADYWVGIEGGVEKINSEMEVFAWVVIKSSLQTGKARTASFFLPTQIAKLVDEGKELGEADDIVFGHTNSKQKMGAVGLLTDNIIDRTKYYTEAVVLALIPFKNFNYYQPAE